MLPSIGYGEASDVNASGFSMNQSGLRSVRSNKSMLENNQPKHNFFHNIKQDREKIAQFMAQSQLLEN